jgi:predicted DCC family thiol-disulfide oxidoreductase YuxK
MELPSDKAIVIFDGVCNFCDRSVRFVMNRDRRGRFLFASNQSEAGSALLARFGVEPGSVQSVYLVEGDRIWSKSTAALEIARRLPLPWKLSYAWFVVPKFLRDLVYDWIARNRYRWFGKAESCRLPSEAERAKFLT